MTRSWQTNWMHSELQLNGEYWKPRICPVEALMSTPRRIEIEYIPFDLQYWMMISAGAERTAREIKQLRGVIIFTFTQLQIICLLLLFFRFSYLFKGCWSFKEMFVTLYSSLYSFNYIIKILFVLNNDTILPFVSMVLSMMIYDFIFH